jgi:hypothetical protein
MRIGELLLLSRISGFIWHAFLSPSPFDVVIADPEKGQRTDGAQALCLIWERVRHHAGSMDFVKEPSRFARQIARPQIRDRPP